MSHEVVVEVVESGVNARLVCSEPPTARCRWAAKCDCEVWYGMDVDALGPYHMADNGPMPSGGAELEDWLDSRHRMEYGGVCQVALFATAADDVLDLYRGPPVTVAVAPVDYKWDGDEESYVWSLRS